MERLTRPNGDWYDAELVRRICEFAECLTVSKSTKSGSTELIKLFPHTRKLIEGIYGWRRADGRRRVRKVFLSTGRKQAKTQSAAIIVMIEFFLGEELEQEIYFAATERDQAAICFNAVAGMVDRAPELRDLVKVTPSSKLIERLDTGSIMKALSSDGAGKHGYNPSLAIYDEFHAWGPTEEELHAALSTGSKSRREPLWLIPTTAGTDKETMCGEEYRYAKRVLAGEIDDPSYLPIIHEIPPDADWKDQSLWPLALPLLETGHHSIEDYQEEFQQALTRPAKQNEFRRLYCNQWTSSVTQWIPMSVWDACGDAASA
jgi:phage terminase large subunit-like protein